MVRAAAFVAGLLFGAGLAVSGMTQPGKVTAFLDVFGSWDPSLAFVMGGALLVFAPTHAFVMARLERPILVQRFDRPTRTAITPDLVIGATIFGAGWGLAGFCPGTAITSLPTASTRVFALVAGVILGILATWGMQKALAEDGSAVTPKADF